MERREYPEIREYIRLGHELSTETDPLLRKLLSEQMQTIREYTARSAMKTANLFTAERAYRIAALASQYITEKIQDMDVESLLCAIDDADEFKKQQWAHSFLNYDSGRLLNVMRKIAFEVFEPEAIQKATAHVDYGAEIIS